MANVIIRPEWQLPDRLVTPESDYKNRRGFLRDMCLTGIGMASAGLMAATSKDNAKFYPAKRNQLFNPNLRKPYLMTKEEWATGYNNFYEFTTRKELVRHPFYMDKFKVEPWKMKIDGLVKKPWVGNAQDLIGEMGKAGALEDRVYRFRCVEAWSMIVPWTGFTLRKLIEKVEPKPEARFVKFTTFFDPANAPGFGMYPNYNWPYTEGLRLSEALNPLAIVATGIYGKPLPKQNGAPIRIVVPWKYGYKSIKSIVRIEFTDKQPKTLWEQAAPDEYPFESNVNPNLPHPRWSQKQERLIGTGDQVPTLIYNGYGKQVAALYK